MSDSDESGVTYTDISSPFEELSDIGSPRADDHEHLMLPEMLKDPYVEAALRAPPSPDYDPVDYHADGGDDGDDEEESSEDDEDEDDEDEEDDEMDVEADKEEEEHPALSNFIVVTPTAADQAPSAEETDPFETDESAATPPPHPAYRTTA
nr:hypothetical protein [Tanacetum cinerariifolium]